MQGLRHPPEWNVYERENNNAAPIKENVVKLSPLFQVVSFPVYIRINKINVNVPKASPT